MYSATEQDLIGWCVTAFTPPKLFTISQKGFELRDGENKVSEEKRGERSPVSPVTSRLRDRERYTIPQG
ncbi:hypothetical protein KQX54_012437 [Cotesia glomerata]|uniref:Uncharacterized protein n=1 Tax=Cotesia glomerata TaxID=32391 RepID=A0AAV7J3P8_COTGL|nr:hypothetical protein KQX54_012437 [Cotesia glomerata]